MRLRLAVVPGLRVTAPVIETATQWCVHGFGATLDDAMLMAADQMLWLLVDRFGLDTDDAYSLCSVGVDFGVTQVVDGTVGCHGLLSKAIFT